ncbi:MAG: SDR family oxidoreductase [Ectothiorhodospiraceae bacterium]|nr:SDR family oxidoreductase [Chromatiales bacterium]MCP5156022.1 SDR family oxidoreductase [Ectothiorhodospiraceae bacterium]
MDLELSGRTVLVTGGSKGIGRAVAEGFAEQGCRLHLVARGAADLERTAAAIRGTHGVEVDVHALDLSDSTSISTLVERVPAVDVLVNNAGAIPGGTLDAVDESTWRAAWDLKVFGYINLTRAYYARMRERGHGVVVNVIGLAGEKVDAGYIAGTAGNASLMAFTRALGGESPAHGIRVLGVNPGAIETERLVGLMRTRAAAERGDADRWQDYVANLPLGRPGKPREVADVVVFLASPRASYVSGTVLAVDCGHSVRGASFR